MLKARIDSNLKVVGPLLAELLRNGLFYFKKPDFAIVASRKVGMRWGFHYCDLLLILSMELPKPGKAPCNPSWGPTGITWGLPRFGQIHRQYQKIFTIVKTPPHSDLPGSHNRKI